MNPNPDSRKASAEIRKNNAGPARWQGIGIFARAEAQRAKAQTFQPRFSLICRAGQEHKEAFSAVLNFCFFCFKTKEVAMPR